MRAMSRPWCSSCTRTLCRRRRSTTWSRHPERTEHEFLCERLEVRAEPRRVLLDRDVEHVAERVDLRGSDCVVRHRLLPERQARALRHHGQHVRHLRVLVVREVLEPWSTRSVSLSGPVFGPVVGTPRVAYATAPARRRRRASWSSTRPRPARRRRLVLVAEPAVPDDRPRHVERALGRRERVGVELAHRAHLAGGDERPRSCSWVDEGYAGIGGTVRGHRPGRVFAHGAAGRGCPRAPAPRERSHDRPQGEASTAGLDAAHGPTVQHNTRRRKRRSAGVAFETRSPGVAGACGGPDLVWPGVSCTLSCERLCTRMVR